MKKVRFLNNNQNKKLVKETVESIFSYSERLLKGIEECVDYFQTNIEKEALDLLVQIVDGFEWIIKAVTLIDEINFNINEFNNNFSEIIKAIENKDYILIGDLLEYEISPLLESLKSEAYEYHRKNFLECYS